MIRRLMCAIGWGLFFLIAVLIPRISVAQLSQQDSSFVDISIARAAKSYTQAFPYSVLIYTGPFYHDYDDGIDGFPYFYDEYFTEGSITVNGKRFNNVNLKYDCVKDILVIDNNLGELELIPDKIDAFEIYGYKFFHLKDESIYHGELKSGFYNILYDGTVKVLAKRYKTYFEDISNRTLYRSFLLKDRFYIVKDGQVKRVRTQASVLRLFKDRKKKIKKNLKNRGIYFQDDFEKATTAAAAIYDEPENGL